MAVAVSGRPELLAPAGSAEAVRAAVLNGADAVYMAGADYNARRGAKNLTEQELYKAIAFCRARGVKTYITVNTLLDDREMPRMAEYAAKLYKAGADAFITADWGAAEILRQTLPGVPLHASTQMTIHNSEGVQAAQKAGFTRVILARELTGPDIASICAATNIEIEVFVHGALCMCYSGLCYMSALIGRRSGNRGLCAQPCRLPYSLDNGADNTYSLSLKDLSLAGRLKELAAMGVKSLKIEGRMKRPEYVAAVCGVFARALRQEREPLPEEIQLLRQIFSRDGFTDGYFTGQKGRHMFGVRGRPEPGAKTDKLYAAMRATYAAGKDTENVQVAMDFEARPGQEARLWVTDPEGRDVCVQGEVPEAAKTGGFKPETVAGALSRTGGTPFAPGQLTVDCGPNLYIPASRLNAMRRQALERLEELRACPPERTTNPIPEIEPIANRQEHPCFTVSALRFEQITDGVLSLAPRRVYLPAQILAEQPEKTKALVSRADIAMIAPPIIAPSEMRGALDIIKRAMSAGASGCLAGNAGLFEMVKDLNIPLYGDTGLNIYNSVALRRMKDDGLATAALSFELTLPMIRDMAKCIDTEVIIYGRLPLMICENCVLKNAGKCGGCGRGAHLTDRSGARFPLVREYGCRMRILNAHTLCLSDKLQDFEKLGLWALRLSFTIESPEECDIVAGAYLARRLPDLPCVTRGLYYRGVE